jgi:hypothetical protein
MRLGQEPILKVINRLKNNKKILKFRKVFKNLKIISIKEKVAFSNFYLI